jgi:aspartyl-tRNA(Asn)/glutamyl-tRNA(Gln) amidotransferase subunit C
MSKLSIEEVKHIAKLSRLELSSDEEDLYAGQLSSILTYVDQLGEVDTDGIEPTANITGLSNIDRADEVKESNISHDNIAKNAPEFRDGSFVVPGVFE